MLQKLFIISLLSFNLQAQTPLNLAKKSYDIKLHGSIFKKPICPVYQNVTARPSFETEKIKKNLIDQLTNPVMWRHTILHMIEDGAIEFTEIGPGHFLSSIVRKIDRNVKTSGIS